LAIIKLKKIICLIMSYFATLPPEKDPNLSQIIGCLLLMLALFLGLSNVSWAKSYKKNSDNGSAITSFSCVDPTITASSNPSAVCAGASVTLTATCSAGTSRWSTRETTTQIVVNPAQTTDYAVFCLTSDGCSSAPVPINVTVWALPDAGPDQILVCSGSAVPSSVTLTAKTNTSSSNGQWYAQASNPTSTTFGSETSLTTTVSGLQPGGTYKFVWANSTGCSDEMQIIVPPCPSPAFLLLTKAVSTTRAKLGDILTYTVVVANSGGTSATNVIVNNALSPEAVSVPNSASVSAGTLMNGSPAQWTIANLAGNATATLIFSASVVDAGVIYCTATLPNSATVQVCTSIPIKVCKGSQQGFELMAPAGYTTYIWYKNGTAQSVNTQSFTAVGAGEYSVELGNGQSTSCLDGSCCPVVIEEEDMLASASLVVGKPSCTTNSTPKTDATLTVIGLGNNVSQYTYQYSTGTAFNAQQAMPNTPKAIPEFDPTVTGLAGGADYTVRITAPGGCYRDITIRIDAVNCACPPMVCVPFTMRKTMARGVPIQP
jgi:trimeric autotransporter adhesin